MLLLATVQGVADGLPLNPIARWEWVFPIVESLHLCGLTLLVGSVTIINFRLLGICLRGQRVSQVARDLAPFIWAGIAIQLTTGPYLFSGDPGEYLQVAAFRYKMLLLILALVFQLTVMVRATAEKWDVSTVGWRKAAAVASMTLWVSVLLGGLWIGNL